MRKTKSQTIVKISAIGLVVFSLGFSVYSFASAWVEPTTTPTGGNIAAPINTGTDPQTKQGTLSVYGLYLNGTLSPSTGNSPNAGYSHYGIYEEPGSWAYPYPDLMIEYHTGIKYIAYYGYGGHRFYTGYQPDAGPNTLAFSVGEGDHNVRVYGDLYVGAAGNWLSTLFSNVLRLDTWQGNHYSGSDGTEYATIFHDTNNSGYYVDPASTSRLNYTVNDNVYAYGWMEAPDLYAQRLRMWSNGGYYLYEDPGNAGWRANSNFLVDGNIYCASCGGWLSTLFSGVLRLDTWQGNHYSASDGREYATIFYDTNNSGYYVDPNSTSRISSLQTDANLLNWPGYNGITQAYGNYIWPGRNDGSGGSWQQSWYLASNSGWGLYTNTGLYAAGTSAFPFIYDSNDTGYYVDPNGNSRMANLYTNANLLNWPGYNGITQAYGNYIWPGRNDGSGGSWQQSWYLASNSGWGLYTNTGLYAAGASAFPIVYDSNNTGYYMDPSGSSRLNQLYYVDSAYVVDLRPQYMYDWNDSNYYMDFNGTSRINYLVTNNHYAYGWVYSESYLQAPIFYDTNSSYYVDPNGTSVLNVVYANQYNCMSDIRLKKDIQPIGNALDKVLTLQGVQFNWKDPAMGTGDQVGIIAQDVQKVLPEVVSKNADGYLGVDYSKLSPLLIEAVKDLKTEKDREINDLRQKIDILEADKNTKDEIINDLLKRVESLESK